MQEMWVGSISQFYLSNVWTEHEWNLSKCVMRWGGEIKWQIRHSDRWLRNTHEMDSKTINIRISSRIGRSRAHRLFKGHTQIISYGMQIRCKYTKWRNINLTIMLRTKQLPNALEYMFNICSVATHFTGIILDLVERTNDFPCLFFTKICAKKGTLVAFVVMQVVLIPHFSACITWDGCW